MEVSDISDSYLISNPDWDPCYLRNNFEESQNMVKLLNESMDDDTLLNEVSKIENRESYCPVTEDISLDDEVLVCAVKAIEATVRSNLTIHLSDTPFTIRQPIQKPHLLERVYKPIHTPHWCGDCQRVQMA